MKIKYEAIDGTLFNHEVDCIQYEQKLNNVKVIDSRIYNKFSEEKYYYYFNKFYNVIDKLEFLSETDEELDYIEWDDNDEEINIKRLITVYQFKSTRFTDEENEFVKYYFYSDDEHLPRKSWQSYLPWLNVPNEVVHLIHELGE